MRSVLFALALIAAAAPAVRAVPVNPNAPDQVAAFYWNNASGTAWLNVLRTNGEVWTWREGTGWYRATGENGTFPYDPPVPLADIADWSPGSFETNSRSLWVLGDGWREVPFPPFAPIATQQKSLGSAKQGYR